MVRPSTPRDHQGAEARRNQTERTWRTKQLENPGTWCWETSQATVKCSEEELASAARGRRYSAHMHPVGFRGRPGYQEVAEGGGQLGASRATTSRAEAAGTCLLLPIWPWNSMQLDLQEGTREPSLEGKGQGACRGAH